MKNEGGFPPKLLPPCREGCEDRKQGRGRKKRSGQARAGSRKQLKSQFSQNRRGRCELNLCGPPPAPGLLCPGSSAGSTRLGHAPAGFQEAFYKKKKKRLSKMTVSNPETPENGARRDSWGWEEKKLKAEATCRNRAVRSSPASPHFNSYAV